VEAIGAVKEFIEAMETVGLSSTLHDLNFEAALPRK
jgi:hypothetical protein